MTKKRNKEANDYFLIRRVEQCNLVFVAALVLLSWIFIGWDFARSALLGGLLSIGSFVALKRTVFGIVSRIGTQNPRIGFAIKFYLRLFVLAVLLVGLIMSIKIHLIGLITGLSTVMVSIIAVVLGRSFIEFLGNQAKGV
jgi:hypothetical protein